jgi:hypothetical protein
MGLIPKLIHEEAIGINSMGCLGKKGGDGTNRDGIDLSFIKKI